MLFKGRVPIEVHSSIRNLIYSIFIRWLLEFSCVHRRWTWSSGGQEARSSRLRRRPLGRGRSGTRADGAGDCGEWRHCAQVCGEPLRSEADL